MTHALEIEDEPMVGLLIEGILLDAAADTFALAGPQQEAAEAAIAVRPDFITSDVHRSQGAGPRAVAEIHAAFDEIPVVFITDGGHLHSLRTARIDHGQAAASRRSHLGVLRRAGSGGALIGSSRKPHRFVGSYRWNDDARQT